MTIAFLGHVVSVEGIANDPWMVENIWNSPTLTDKEG